MKWWQIIGLILALQFTTVLPVLATASSSNYRVEEDFIGSGGLTDESSSNFHAKETIGDLAVGETGSANFQTNNGFTTTNDPTLSFLVTSSTINLGTLSSSSTATGTATFTVKNYTSWGYVVLTTSQPPNNGSGHTLAPMTTAGASAAGTEQFGINLVANTSPANFGADPVQVPSSNFSSGVAASGYNTANTFKYVVGDVIASAPKASGETDYTVSYIANVNNTTTGGGQYTGGHDLVVVGTY